MSLSAEDITNIKKIIVDPITAQINTLQTSVNQRLSSLPCEERGDILNKLDRDFIERRAKNNFAQKLQNNKAHTVGIIGGYITIVGAVVGAVTKIIGVW